jgi:Zn-dependent protease with chaperone function
MRGRPGLYRAAVKGGAVLAVARGFFGAYALVVGGIVVVALGLAALWGGQAVGIVDFGSPLLRVPSLSGPLLAVAVGLPLDDPWVAGLSRRGWVRWAALVWTLFGLSVGELAWKRRRLRRCLEKHPPGDAPSHRTLVERADRLGQGSGGPPVGLAVTPDPAIKAFAHRFAWPRRRWIIQVSEGALEHLTPEELEALLAHELAHLRRGHVLCHDLILWCGRVAFLGDGFCRGLLNSFGWESIADREAARILGSRKQALVRCIWKIAANNPRLDFSTGAEGLGIEAASSVSRPGDCGPDDAANRSFWLRWRFLWCRFLQQYLGGSELHYWHPTPDERAERIRRVEAMTEAETTA